MIEKDRNQREVIFTETSNGNTKSQNSIILEGEESKEGSVKKERKRNSENGNFKEFYEILNICKPMSFISFIIKQTHNLISK